jgi:hypothetical protein
MLMGIDFVKQRVSNKKHNIPTHYIIPNSTTHPDNSKYPPKIPTTVAASIASPSHVNAR